MKFWKEKCENPPRTQSELWIPALAPLHTFIYQLTICVHSLSERAQSTLSYIHLLFLKQIHALPFWRARPHCELWLSQLRRGVLWSIGVEGFCFLLLCQVPSQRILISVNLSCATTFSFPLSLSLSPLSLTFPSRSLHFSISLSSPRWLTHIAFTVRSGAGSDHPRQRRPWPAWVHLLNLIAQVAAGGASALTPLAGRHLRCVGLFYFNDSR